MTPNHRSFCASTMPEVDIEPAVQEDRDEREPHRDLVGDDLRGRAQCTEQRVRRSGRPAGEHDAVHADRGDRQDVEHAHGEVGQLQRRLDVGERHRDHRAERDHRDREEGRDRGDERREDEDGLVDGLRDDVFLEHQLDAVGETLEQTEGSVHVGADAVLHAGHHATLQPDDEQRHHQQDHEGEHDLDDDDPPVVVAEGAEVVSGEGDGGSHQSFPPSLDSDDRIHPTRPPPGPTHRRRHPGPRARGRRPSSSAPRPRRRRCRPRTPAGRSTRGLWTPRPVTAGGDAEPLERDRRTRRRQRPLARRRPGSGSPSTDRLASISVRQVDSTNAPAGRATAAMTRPRARRPPSHRPTARPRSSRPTPARRVRKPSGPPSSSAMPARTRTSVRAELSSTWANGRSRASQLTKVPLRSARPDPTGSTTSARRVTSDSRTSRLTRKSTVVERGDRGRPVGQVVDVDGPDDERLEVAGGGGGEDAGGVAARRGRDQVDAPGGCQVDPRLCVVERAAAGQQVGQQPGLERATLTRTTRNPAQLGAGRRREGGDRADRRPGDDAARSPTRMTPPPSSATSPSLARPATTEASAPGVARTRLPCSFSSPREVCEVTAYTRVPWCRTPLRSRRKTIGDSSSGSNPTRTTEFACSRSAYDGLGRVAMCAARKDASSAGVRPDPEVDVVGAEDGPGELAVGVGVLAGEPTTGEHADGCSARP